MKLVTRLIDYKNRPFFQSSVILMSGTVIGQLIPIVSAPIVTRIYSPDQYGVFGVFLILTSIFSLFSTFQIENAILIEKEESKAETVMQLCLFLSLLFFLGILLISILFKNIISEFFKAPALKEYLLFLPIIVLLSGVTNSLTAWANRLGLYKGLSFQRVITAITTPLVTIIVGYITKSILGLFVGFTVGLFVGFIILYIIITNTKYNKFKFSYREMKDMFYRYSSIPKYNLPSQFMNMFLIQFPGMLLSKYYSVSAVGYYNLSNRMLNIPTLLISQSIGELYKKKASSEFHQKGNCEQSFLTFFKLLFFISIIPFLVLFIFSPSLFGFVFGEDWIPAGIFSRIMTLMFFLRFIISPLTFVSFLREKLKIHLVFTAILLITTVAVSTILVIYNAKVEELLLGYVLTYSFIYLIMFYINYKFSKNP